MRGEWRRAQSQLRRKINVVVSYKLLKRCYIYFCSEKILYHIIHIFLTTYCLSSFCGSLWAMASLRHACMTSGWKHQHHPVFVSIRVTEVKVLYYCTLSNLLVTFARIMLRSLLPLGLAVASLILSLFIVCYSRGGHLLPRISSRLTTRLSARNWLNATLLQVSYSMPHFIRRKRDLQVHHNHTFDCTISVRKWWW